MRQGAEQLLQFARAQAEVVILEQRLVETAAVGQTLAVRARQLYVSLQRRGEAAEVILRARPLPGLLAIGAGASALGRKLRWNAPRPLPVAPRHPHEIAVDIAEIRAFCLLQPRSDVLRGGTIMGQARERAERERAGAGTLGGHHHELVPGRQHLQGREVCELCSALAQVANRTHAWRVWRRHDTRKALTSSRELRCRCVKSDQDGATQSKRRAAAAGRARPWGARARVQRRSACPAGLAG